MLNYLKSWFGGSASSACCNTSSTASSIATAASPTARRRTSQSEDEYQNQLADYRKKGPVIQNNEAYLLNRDFSDASKKVERQRLKSAAERAYFNRDYELALHLIDKTQDWIVVEKERKEYDGIKNRCLEKLGK